MTSGFLTILSFLLVFAGPIESRAQDARAVIQGKIDRTLAILRDTGLQNSDNLPALRRRLIAELEPLFTFREIAIRALGVHARQLKPEQIDALTASFKRLLERVYIDQLTAHLVKSDNPYKIVDILIARQELKGNYAKIYSLAKIRKNAEEADILMNYRMVNRADQWKVYDVEIEGVSLIENYRSQFNEVLTNNSFDSLLQSIEHNVRTLDADQVAKPRETIAAKKSTEKNN